MDVPGFKSTVEGVPLFTDEDEYTAWKGRGDPVLHIRLRDWADYLLVAPLSANSLAKMANGLCDNLVVLNFVTYLIPETCVFRAWDFQSKPVLLAPAMNTQMWESHFTSQHLNILTSAPLNCKVIGPIEQLLECLDYGTFFEIILKWLGLGAMTKPPEILEMVKETLPSQEFLKDRRERAIALQEKRMLMLQQRISAAKETK